jgi:DNA repair protein RecO (recombination protein O)
MIRDEAIVLRRWDWSETSQTTLLFCKEHGLLRGLAKGAKRPKGRFSGGFEPMTLGEVVAIVKPTTELATLTEWDLHRVYPGVRRNVRAFQIAHYFADLIACALHDVDPHRALWNATVRSLEELDSPNTVEFTLARFQWALLEETGYRPDLAVAREAIDKHDVERTFVYDPDRGALAEDCAHSAQSNGWRIRGATVKCLMSLNTEENERLADDASETIERVNRFLAACIRWSIGEEPRTMRLIFGGSVFGSSGLPGINDHRAKHARPR